jgi:hypothetical protein
MLVVGFLGLNEAVELHQSVKNMPVGTGMLQIDLDMVCSLSFINICFKVACELLTWSLSTFMFIGNITLHPIPQKV